ncbi:MAG TPA: hypothetical protein PLZ36_04025 [Armatimonadota bacterium]|nr:hypothetical protein [Armatimonadota bacterium]
MTWRDLFFASTGRVRSGWRALIFLFVALLLLNLLGVVVSIPLLLAGVKPQTSPVLELLLFGLAATPAVLAAGAWTASRFERLPLATLGLSPHAAWPARLAGGFLGGAALVALFLCALRAAGFATLTVRLPSSQEWAALGLLACCLLVASAGAVLLLLGYGFQTLLRGAGVPVALGVCALAYTLLMAMQTPGSAPLQHVLAHPLLYVTLLLNCLLLGLLYLRSGSLWLPIGVNAGWNFGLALFYLPLGTEAPLAPTPLRATLIGDPQLVGGPLGPESGAFVALLHLVLLAGVALAPCGRPLASRWWMWPALSAAPATPRAWDFAIGARRYQWRLAVPEDTE